MYLYDYHMHSLNSSDGRNSITDMCVKAVAVGLREIAITDHFEPTRGNEKYPYYKPDSYFFDMLKARVIFGTHVNIKYAVELGQPHLYPEYSLKLIESYPYDYVLASAHKMKDDTDFGEIVYDQNNREDYCFKYLDELKSLVQWNRFDCIGHLDLVKRYASQYDVKVNFMDYREKLEEIFKILIKNGKGIEINTSGLRQHAKECLPGLDIVKFYRQLGGEIITVGSDAHNSEDVGKGIRDGIEIAKAAGFDYMTVYTRRQPFMIRTSEKASAHTLAPKFA